MTPEAQISATLLYAAESVEKYLDTVVKSVADILDGGFFGIIRMKRRLFQVGDIVIGRFNNGMGERWPVTGVSSKGFKVKDMYVDFQRRRYGNLRLGQRTQIFNNRTQGRLLVVPDALRALSLADPALRAWLVAEACSARRNPVTADSGDFF